MNNNQFSSHQMSSGFKWFMLIFIIIIVLSTIISLYSNSVAKTSITEKVSGATEQTVIQAVGKLDQMLSVYESIGQQMLRNEKLRNTLAKLPDYKTNAGGFLFAGDKEIKPMLNAYRDSVPHVAYVRLIKKDGWKDDKKEFFTSVPSTDMKFEQRDEELITRIIKNDGKPLWSNTSKNGYFVPQIDSTKNSGGYSFLMGQLLKDLRNPDKNFVATIEVKIAAIEKLMENVDFGENSEFMLVSNEHQVIYAKDTKLIGTNEPYGIQFNENKGSVITSSNQISYIVAYAKSASANWFLVTRIPVESLHKEVNQISTYALITLVLLLAVVVGTLFMFNRFINLFKKLAAFSQELNLKSIELEHTNEELMLKNNRILEQSEELQVKNDRLQNQSKQLEQQNAELEELNRIKDQILANTSHELRTPINGIIGIAESMLDGIAGAVNDIARKNLLIIINSGRRLTNLVNDILDFSKMKNEKLQLTQRALGIEAIVDMVVLLSKPLVGEKKLEIKNTCSKNLPLVWADDHRIQQIFHNLISNAIKFTEAGEITIHAEVLDEMMKISVKDTGIGIPHDKFDRVFKSFEQVDGSTQRNYGGTGLGLAVTKQLIELHGGRITLESEFGKGTTFIFYIPLATDDQMLNTEPDEVKSVFSERELQSAVHFEPIKYEQLGDINILVVDDEPINLQVLANHLQAHDYGITTAASGVEALAILKQNKIDYDLVLLDVMMPKLSGYEVCRAIRQTKALHELPVILLTAKNQPEDVILGFQSGANDYLTKPFAKEELIMRMQTQLRLAKSYKQIRVMKERFESNERA